MSDILLNGIRCFSAQIRLPVTGNWTAHVAVDTATAPTGAVTLTCRDGLELRGTVRSGSAWQQASRVIVEGGAGGLRKSVSARGYRMVDASVPLVDLLSESGEALDGSPPTLFLRHWARHAGPASSALTALATACGLTWRVLPNGKISLTAPTWADAKLPTPVDVLNVEPDIRRTVLGVVAPSLLPGTRYRNEAVRYVVHTVEPSSTRTEYWAGDVA